MGTTATQLCAVCDNVGLERTRFFQRQLVTASDFTQDQSYFLEKLRRHNRLLHGWGVVCGARCRKGDGDCEVIIEPGYILGPYGDEIVIDREVTIDVCRQDLDGDVAGPCGQPADPWCSNVRIDRRAGDKLYIAVRYAECQDRPVRVMGGGCGCDSHECEYSRIRDSYAFRVLTKLPTTYPEPMPKPPDPSTLWKCREGGCPLCPAEPWVILADVTLGGDGKVSTPDCFSHRRHVVSFADFYYMCRAEAVSLLQVKSVKLLDSSSKNKGTTLTNPKEMLTLPSKIRPDTIEVMFGDAMVNRDTVKDKETFKVEHLGKLIQLQSGTISWLEDNRMHWKLERQHNFQPGTYQVTLVGNAAADSQSIKSKEGSPLDGEAESLLPSGDGSPGGDFVFTFEVR